MHKTIPSDELAAMAVHGMQEKKASDIITIDLRGMKNAVTDFFVICSGGSDTQIEAVADSVEKSISEKTGDLPHFREGKQNKEWMLLDYINVVVHVFNKEKRAFYALEELWGDAVITEIKEPAV